MERLQVCQMPGLARARQAPVPLWDSVSLSSRGAGLEDVLGPPGPCTLAPRGRPGRAGSPDGRSCRPVPGAGPQPGRFKELGKPGDHASSPGSEHSRPVPFTTVTVPTAPAAPSSRSKGPCKLPSPLPALPGTQPARAGASLLRPHTGQSRTEPDLCFPEKRGSQELQGGSRRFRCRF